MINTSEFNLLYDNSNEVEPYESNDNDIIGRKESKL